MIHVRNCAITQYEGDFMFDFTKLEPVSISNRFDALDDSFSENDSTACYHVFNVDPLILSCVAYRIRQTRINPHPYSHRIVMDSQILAENIIEQDIQLAAEIREDFAKKLVYFALTVGPLSKFKQTLNEFLTTDFQRDGCFHLPERFIGMIHMLPCFHDYNMKQQALFTEQLPKIKHDVMTSKRQLVYLTTLDPARKKTREKIEFWFKDVTDGIRVMALFNKNDPLLPLLRKNATDGITVSGTFKKRSNYATEYYVLHNWEIVND